MAHHRILGKTRDFITGKEIIDTDDERVRQKIAHFLVEGRGYEKEDIEVRVEKGLVCGREKATAMINFVVNIDGKRAMLIKYGQGSVVSRERVVLAAARIFDRYQIPFAVITNGDEGEVLDSESGEVLYSGLEGIPSKKVLKGLLEKMAFKEIPDKKREIESRILFTFEAIEHSSECDDEFCITEAG